MSTLVNLHQLDLRLGHPGYYRVCSIICVYQKVPVYESFVDGAKDGFSTAISIIPHLVGMMVAISVFRASGALDFVISLLAPLVSWMGVPGKCCHSGFCVH